MTLYSWIFSEDREDLSFLKAFFLLLMASLHVSLKQTVLCLRLRTENLLLEILFLTMVINFSVNSSSENVGYNSLAVRWPRWRKRARLLYAVSS